MSSLAQGEAAGKRVTLYFTGDLDDKITQIAAEERRSKSQVVRLLLEKVLHAQAAMSPV